MTPTHFPSWPTGLPQHLTAPATSVFTNLEISARRYPEQRAIIFYDSVLSYRQLLAEVEALAGYLQQACGVQRGDRVLLDMQNSPQFVIAYYAILRADAMVVPVNPMLMTEELRHYVDDSGAKVAIAAQEVFPRLAPLMGDGGLAHAVVATYSDYLTASTDLPVPDFVAAPRAVPAQLGVVAWHQALAEHHTPRPHLAGPDDLACMPYTSAPPASPRAACIPTAPSCSPRWPAPIGPARRCRTRPCWRCCRSSTSPACRAA